MNATAGISLLYGIMTLCSMSILFFSFKGKADPSGRFFLTAEFFLFFIAVYLFMINIDPSLKRPAIFFLGNSVYLIAETSIIFGIYTLTHPTPIFKYLLAVTGAVLYCAFMEYVRPLDPSLPLLLGPLIYVLLLAWTLFICRAIKDHSLYSNPFLKWFVRAEYALMGIALFRIIGYFNYTQITPTGSDTSAALVVTLYAAANIFRYISYQSLRMTWADPVTPPNFLNQKLALTTTQNSQLIEKLINSNRLLGISALASTLAHQLSQPLTGISLLADSVKRNLTQSNENEKTISFLNTISMELTKLSNLVCNLRGLFSAQDPVFDKHSLQQITDEVLKIIDPKLLSKRIMLIRIYESNPMILGNSIQLQQVIINIVNNAVDAIEKSNSKNREIILKITQSDIAALLTIEDSGNGISQEILPTLFELYKTTKSEGLGVGLWLSQTIIKNHQGSITAVNGSNGGAIFKIELPLAP